MDALPLQDLKRLCRERGLASGGTKAELIARLNAADVPSTSLRDLKEQCRAAGLSVFGSRADLAARLAAATTPPTVATIPEEPKPKKNPAKAKAKAAPPTGETKKPAKAPATSREAESYENLSVMQLKELCVKRKLHVNGPKEKLIARLRFSRLTIAELSDIAKRLGVSVGGKRSHHIEKLTVNSVRERALAELSNVPPRPKPVRYKPYEPSAEEVAEAKATEARQHEAATRFKQSMMDAFPASGQPMSSLFRPIVPSCAAMSATCFVVYSVEASSHNSDSPSFGFSRVFSTQENANAQVRRVFYEEHPDGWLSHDFERHASDVNETYDNGLLTLALQVPQKPWSTSTVCVPASSPLVAKVRENYIICSWQSYFAFGGGHFAPKVKFHRVCDTKTEANVLAEKIFYQENPWGMSKFDLENDDGPSRSTRDGLLRLARMTGRGENWAVNVHFSRGGEVPESEQCYIVGSKNICHVTGDPYFEYSPLLKSKEEANKLVTKVFYQHNPWAWSQQDFEHKSVKTKQHDGLLELSLRFEGQWTVGALEVPPGSNVSPGRQESVIFVLSATGCHRREPKPKEKLSLEIERIVSSKVDANASVEEIFYDGNSVRLASE